MPSRDTQWIIGTVLAAAIALSVQIGVQFSSLRSEQAGIRTDMRNEHAEIRADMRRMDDRLRAVEVEFGKVDQRLATLERLHLPTPAFPAIDQGRAFDARGWHPADDDLATDGDVGRGVPGVPAPRPVGMRLRVCVGGRDSLQHPAGGGPIVGLAVVKGCREPEHVILSKRRHRNPTTNGLGARRPSTATDHERRPRRTT